jgi:cellulose synthase/poly-beta-1,6-N-acetylglucosamine synthase-like glycosyltransferase/peptidoglycan/xylan/chitin deacetylase (PgdA/CDA1 family)
MPIRRRWAGRSEAGRSIGRKIESPPAHWALLILLFLALALVLFAEGLSEHRTGRSATPGEPAGEPAVGPRDTVLSLDGSELAGEAPPPGRRIALTFDDGPDPEWTPRIADRLRELGVPATFFVVGERVVRHPDVVRRLREDGFELGNHTFNHSDLTGSGDTERALQLSLTESAIAGAAGVRPRLVRPPYSATPAAVGEEEASAFQKVAEKGYIVALSDIDSEDWRRPGVDEIVRNATPPGRSGGVVLMHDGGANRSQTLEAIDRLVPALRARGFEFVDVGELLGLPDSELEPAASSGEKLRGDALVTTLRIAGFVTGVLTVLLIPIAVLALLRALFVVALARRHARRWRRLAHPEGFNPPASIIVPAYNESAGIEAAVRSFAASDHPEFEVIVVDDGSDDATGDIVAGLGLPAVELLREPNRGKAAALNAGIARARYEIVVAVDADTVFEPSTLSRLLRPFAEESVGAVAGNAKVANRKGLLGRWQHIEYVMGFNLDRRLYDVLNCMPTVPGAIGAFRRSALAEAGGFSSDTLAEDTDLTIALGRAGWKAVYAEDARGYTEAPATLSGLWRQRYRWSFGTMQSVWKHRAALLRRDGRAIGRMGLPYLIAFQILLPLLAPLIDLFAVYGIVFLDPVPVIGYWLAFNALLLGLAVYAFKLDGESLRPLWALPLQQVVYRQLMYLVVIQSIASALQGLRLRWQHVERSGDLDLDSVRALRPGSPAAGKQPPDR